MHREEALDLVKSKVKNKNLIKHMIATEACMAELAQYFGEDKDVWSLAGLLHDIDYDQTLNDPANHGRIAMTILEPYNLERSILDAILAHPGHIPPKNRLDWALYSVDPLTGLIVAACLMHPAKKLSALDTEFVLRRFKEKRFAAGANREQIMKCQQLGLNLEEFIRLCLNGMQKVSDQLEL